MNKLTLVSLILLGLAVLLIGSVAFAALVRVLRCPDHDQDRDLINLNPCLVCNGYGRSTLFQRWNHLRYEMQQGPFSLSRR